MPEMVTKLKMVSFGVVAEMKTRDTSFEDDPTEEPHPGKIVEAVPIEWLPSSTCDVTIETETIMIVGTDSKGVVYNASVDRGYTVPAEWLPFGTNRITAPDLRIGERIMLWNYAGTDKYYWTELGRDDNLRKLETVIFAISNTTDETDTVLTAENTYFVSMSTHDKRIHLSTSMSNGEPYRYDVILDTDAGNLTIKDSDDNTLLWDTAATVLKFTNRETTDMEFNLKNWKLYTPDQLDTYSEGKTIQQSIKLMKLICPRMEVGDKGLEPSVLGDKLSDYLTKLCDKLDQHKHIGNLGAPTSTMMAVEPLALQPHYEMTSGHIFSKVNFQF